MKVLQINPYPPEHLGGSEIFCKNLSIDLLKRYNIHSDILTSDIYNKKINIDILEDSINVIYKKNYYNLWGKNPLVNVYSYLKKHYQEYDIIHAHSYIFFTSFQCALLRKFHKFPLVLHIHGGYFTPQVLSSSPYELIQLVFKNILFDKLIGKFTIKAADCIISVLNKDLSLFKERYEISENKMHYVPNGIDITKFQNNDEFKRKYITFIGRLSYIKGIDIFLDFIEKLYQKDKELHFLIVGDGALSKLVKEKQKKLPIKHYSSFPYKDIEKIYNKSKLLIIPSRFEGLPTILLEGLACETPIISNNVGGVSEVLKNDQNGFVFHQINRNLVVDKVLNLIHDKEKLCQLGKNGRNLIKKTFTWEIISDKISEIYKQLLLK